MWVGDPFWKFRKAAQLGLSREPRGPLWGLRPALWVCVRRWPWLLGDWLGWLPDSNCQGGEQHVDSPLSGRALQGGGLWEGSLLSRATARSLGRQRRCRAAAAARLSGRTLTGWQAQGQPVSTPPEPCQPTSQRAALMATGPRRRWILSLSFALNRGLLLR